MLFIYAGFRPRIFCSTFEDTDLVRTAHEPTSKVRSHHAAHIPARSQYVQKNVCTYFIYAGFRPRIKRNICTFGLRLAKSNSPENTFAQCSPCASKKCIESELSAFFLAHVHFL